MNWIIVILGIVVVILFYILYKFYYSNSNSLSKSTSLKIANPDIAVTSSPATSRYTYGIWMYVNSWDNTVTKPIFSRPVSTSNTNSQIYLYLDKTTTTLKFNVLYADSSTGTDIIVTDNFPLQKWVYFTASVDNQYIDLYLDGKLVKSVKMTATLMTPGDKDTPIKLGTMTVGSTTTTTASDIFIAQFIRWISPLSPQDVWSQYMAGNGGSMFSNLLGKYGVAVSITNSGTDETSKYTLI